MAVLYGLGDEFRTVVGADMAGDAAQEKIAPIRHRSSRLLSACGRPESSGTRRRGTSLALAFREISYIHCEGYAAGEFKYGPIALIDETMPVIVIAPHDKMFEKTVSNMQRLPHAVAGSF